MSPCGEERRALLGGRPSAPPLSQEERQVVERFEAAPDGLAHTPQEERDLLLDQIDDWRVAVERVACGPRENVWSELSVVIRQMRWALEDHLPQWERDLLTGGA